MCNMGISTFSYNEVGVGRGVGGAGGAGIVVEEGKHESVL